jgi:hypothetical protein
MVAPELEKLRGVVEMDETWVGGLQAGLRGSRQLNRRKAALVIVAVERRGTATGRARMEVIPDFTQKTMTAFACANIEPGTTIITDKMTGFDGLTAAGFVHRPAKQGKIIGESDHVVPHADRAMGNMKQWLLGTFHGVSREQPRSTSTNSCSATIDASTRRRRSRRCSGSAPDARRLRSPSSGERATCRSSRSGRSRGKAGHSG